MLKNLSYCFILVLSLILFSCKSGEKSLSDDDKEIIIIEDNTQVIPAEIIAEIYKDASIEDMVEDFSEYKMEMLKKVAPSLNMYLLYYDISSVDPEKMLKLVRNHQSVKAADFNKKISNRD